MENHREIAYLNWLVAASLLLWVVFLPSSCREKSKPKVLEIEVLGTIDGDSGNTDEQLERYRGQLPDSELEAYKAVVKLLVSDSLKTFDSLQKINNK